MRRDRRDPPQRVDGDGLSRRGLFVGAGGLTLAFALPGCRSAPPDDPAFLDEGGAPSTGAALALNAHLRIAPDGVVTVRVAPSEMGQGVLTALPMLVAEELDVPLAQVRAEMAPAHAAYRFGIYGLPIGFQLTGASRSVMEWFDPLREAGATAWAMLIAAAARRWGVEASALRTEAGEVIGPDGQRAGYGDLATDASSVRPPRGVALRDPTDWALIGTSPPRLDVPPKTDGSAVFGIDVRLPDQRFASVRACPIFGGALASADEAAALAMPGVEQVVRHGDWIGVIADSTWRAMRALDALDPEWAPPEGSDAEMDTEGVRAALWAGLEGGGSVSVHGAGDLEAALAAGEAVEADYEVPYLHHWALEPLNATARVTATRAEVWAPTQAQEDSLKLLRSLTGLRADACRIHTTYLGGGFGRKAQTDFVEQAIRMAMASDGRPVQVTWTREEDTRRGFYRPGFVARLRGAAGTDGRPSAFGVHLCGENLGALYVGHRMGSTRLGVRLAVEGLDGLEYPIPNQRTRYTIARLPIPVGQWRSVGHSYTAWFKECFLDELAHAGGQDPLALRLELLAGEPLRAAVLRAAAEAIGWGEAPPGRAHGVAQHASFGSLTAAAAEVSVEGGRLRVHRLAIAADCGPIVHPDIVRQQLEGGALFGLSAALQGAIGFEGGAVAQRNFTDHPLMRMSQSPSVEVRLMEDTGHPVGGVGEIAVPPIAPAVGNAIFAATGQRIRRLPFSLTLDVGAG